MDGKDATLYLLGLLTGIILLWWSGSRSVKYSVRTANLFGFGTFFLGFVLMAVSTGIPELAIAVMSAWKGAVQLSAGDILGSNLHDISMVLGIPILCFGTIHVRGEKDRKELLVSLAMAAAVMALVFAAKTLTWWHGLVLLFIYILYLVWLATLEHPVPAVETHEVPHREMVHGKDSKLFDINHFGRYSVVLKLLASLGLVVLAAHMSVSMALALTATIGIPIETLGVSFFALGSSLPELVVSIHSIKNKEYSLAVGNAIGSVFQQGTCILGFLTLLSTKGVNTRALWDIVPFMFLCFGILGYGMWQRNKVGRYEAAGMVATYVVFIGYRLWGVWS